jgi:hypothetical protein
VILGWRRAIEATEASKPAPAPQPIIANMYGMVTIARDQPNSASIGGKNKLNELMPMDVIVTTIAESRSTSLRESYMIDNGRLNSYARQSDGSSIDKIDIAYACPQPLARF